MKLASKILSVWILGWAAVGAPFDAWNKIKPNIPARTAKPAGAKFKGFTGDMMGSNTKTQMIQNMAS